jgi:hypothetical protein
MKSQELKQIIKPLIKECLREVLIEEGFAKMLAESVKPQQAPVMPQQAKVAQRQIQEPVEQKRVLQEARKRALDNIGGAGFDAFAGTQPLREQAEVKGADPGVDISGLLGNKQVWKQTLDSMSGKKSK